MDLRTSLVANHDRMFTQTSSFKYLSLSESEKSGFWTLSNDSRLKSLKRRFVILKNGEILFFRNNVSARIFF